MGEGGWGDIIGDITGDDKKTFASLRLTYVIGLRGTLTMIGTYLTHSIRLSMLLGNSQHSAQTRTAARPDNSMSLSYSVISEAGLKPFQMYGWCKQPRSHRWDPTSAKPQ